MEYEIQDKRRDEAVDLNVSTPIDNAAQAEADQCIKSKLDLLNEEIENFSKDLDERAAKYAQSFRELSEYISGQRLVPDIAPDVLPSPT